MNKPELILIGGGGHCKSCIDVIEQENVFEIAGIIDVPKKLGEEILGYKIIGNDNDIPQIAKKGANFLITLGQLVNPELRIKLFEIVKQNGSSPAIIISPLSYVSKYAEIKEGTIIMHNVIINANAEIGENCIINSKALVEHDVIISDNVHVSTNTIINGDCEIGANCLIGSGVIITQSTKICSNAIIGAGAVVIKDIVESGVYVGNPAKKIK